MNVSAWRQHVAATAIPSPTRLNDSGFQTQFLSGEHILDIRRTGQPKALGALLRQVTRVKLVDPDRDGKVLPFPDESQDAVCSDRLLQHIADYRGAIAEWFRVLRVGGFLIITVPHQFLFERKISLPSRFDASHQRFYTAASLLLEIEEALDPLSYRVRFLEDNDAGFDYTKPHKHAPSSGCEVVVVLEEIEHTDHSSTVLADLPAEIQHHGNSADRPHAGVLRASPASGRAPTRGHRSKACPRGRNIDTIARIVSH